MLFLCCSMIMQSSPTSKHFSWNINYSHYRRFTVNKAPLTSPKKQFNHSIDHKPQCQCLFMCHLIPVAASHVNETSGTIDLKYLNLQQRRKINQLVIRMINLCVVCQTHHFLHQSGFLFCNMGSTMTCGVKSGFRYLASISEYNSYRAVMRKPHLSFSCLQRLRSMSETINPSLQREREGVHEASGAEK